MTKPTNAHGILVRGTSSTPLQAITISNSYVYNIATGFSEALTVTGNVYNFFLNNISVHDITNIGIDIAGHYPNPGVPANVNYARTGTVRACTVYNCNVPSATMDVSAGIYIDGASDINVEYNRSYQNGVGYSIGCETPNKTATMIRMRDNIATYNKEVGLSFGSSTASSKIVNCKVMNNTFALNYQNLGFGAEVSLYNNENSIIKQNIFVPVNNTSVALGQWQGTTIGLQSSYNLYWRLNANTSNMTENVTIGTNPIIGNPKFNSTNWPPNLHLLTGSKAINTGDPNFTIASGETDIDFQARIQQGRVDIGADESPLPSIAGPTIPDTEQDIVISVYPNPVSNDLDVNFKEPLTGEIYLYDVNGKLMETYQVQGEYKKNLDLTKFANGIYFLKVGSQSLKFVKE